MPEKIQIQYLIYHRKAKLIYLLTYIYSKESAVEWNQKKTSTTVIDSTPDIGHREQFSQVIRFVDVDFQTKNVAIKRSFLGFVQIHSKDTASLERIVVEKLESANKPLADCRSQWYDKSDNADVMTGHISGIQQRTCARNHRALFVNWINHSLNLPGVQYTQLNRI